MFVRPCAKYPKGKYYIWAHGVLLRESNLPSDMWTIEAIDWFPMPNRLYPMSFLEDMDPLQRAYNEIISYWMEANARKLRGDMVVSGYGEPTSREDAETGAKIITIDEGSTFKMMEYNLDTSLSQLQIKQIREDMDDTAGLHPPSLGEGGPKRTLGETQLLTSQDSQGIGTSLKVAARAYDKVAVHKVALLAKHVKNLREYALPGRGAIPKMTKFYGSDLADIADIVPIDTPNLTDTQILQARQQLSEAKVFEFEDGPNFANDMLAKSIIARSSGIPGIEDEMEAMTGFSVEDLTALVSDINRTRAMMCAIQTKVQFKLATDPNALLHAAMQAGAQIPPPQAIGAIAPQRGRGGQPALPQPQQGQGQQ
jgi:hypothetical protein